MLFYRETHTFARSDLLLQFITPLRYTIFSKFIAWWMALHIYSRKNWSSLRCAGVTTLYGWCCGVARRRWRCCDAPRTLASCRVALPRVAVLGCHCWPSLRRLGLNGKLSQCSGFFNLLSHSLKLKQLQTWHMGQKKLTFHREQGWPLRAFLICFAIEP